MKVSLVVAAGAHQGRTIPITIAEFIIGRDPQCQLRPASQAISKQHCGILIRNGRVFVKDYGSTNGTQVNGELVQGTEVEVENGAAIAVGPLEFTLKVEATVAKADGTPLPGSKEMAALAAVKAASAGSKPGTAPARDTTPNPASKPPVKPVAGQPEEDRIAAMILNMENDDDSSSSGSAVPDDSTVTDMPLPAGATAEGAKDGKTDDKPKKAQTREEMSNAANDLLRKYIRRPK
jgi:predicted component of type VI protein secretion system